MANAIKYTTGSETLALKKGNFYIGTGDVGKGPTSTTGYYNGITPPSGGYTIYLNKVSGGPSIYTCANDTELISITNSIAGTSYTTANECFTYFTGQTDKMVLNRDYEGIVTDGLALNLDAGFTPSYPKNGTTWYDLGNSTNATLINGPTFDSSNGGSIVYDGVDDYLSVSNSVNDSFFNSLYPNGITIMTWVFLPSDFSIPNNDGRSIFYRGSGGAQGNWWHFSLNQPSNNPANGIKMRWWVGGGNSYNPWIHYAGTSLQQNTLYHCTLTWKIINSTQANTKMYLNGVVDYSNTSTKSQGISLSDATILGNYPDANWNPYFKQYNLMVYSKELTQTEILQNYNAQKGRFGL